MLEKLRTAVFLPSKLSEVGATGTDIQGLAEKALTAQRLLDLSPRKATADDITAMLKASFEYHFNRLDEAKAGNSARQRQLFNELLGGQPLMLADLQAAIEEARAG